MVTSAKIALVKGEGELPPLTRADCQWVAYAAFLPYHPVPRSEVTQLVGWFDPRTGSPQIVERIDVGGRREPLAVVERTADCQVVELFRETPLQVCFSCRAAATPPRLPAPTQRTLYVALAGAHGHVWYDGYLAHLAADGSVLSLLTQPGQARLLLPHTQPDEHGIEPAAVTLPAAAHYLRQCLRAQLAAFCRQRSLQGSIVVAIDDTSLAAMVCVVLLSSLHCIAVTAPALSPAWRRLLQNLGVRWVKDAPMLAVTELVQLTATIKTTMVARDINSQAAVIPARMLAD